MNSFPKKLIIFLISLIFILGLIFLNASGKLKPVKSITATAFKPCQIFLNSMGNRFFYFTETIKNISTLQRRNKELEDQVNALNAEIIRLKEVSKENEALREQLGFAQKSDYKLLPAEIIGYEPENFFQYLIVNKGAVDGVKQGMFVLSAGYLIGKISEVYNRGSKLLLVTNLDSSVGAMIQDSRALGVVKGELGGGMIMEMIPQNEIVRIGDVVCTSGLGGDYPRGLPIGMVQEIKSKPNDLFQTVSVKSPIDFKKLEMVFISLNK